jgi:3-oxoacyl-[acyl-carrier protein] reductase
MPFIVKSIETKYTEKENKTDFTNNMKYAVVTGGTSGIGLGVATMLLSKGYYVFATYVGPEFKEKIENFEAIYTDQSSREEVYRFISYVKTKTDHLDCLVCNAGMTIRKSFTETLDSDWDKMMEVAVNSHYIMVREFFPIIPAGSRILFTGSQMGLSPHATVLAYGVTKAAIHALTKNLVKEFEGTGTTVNAIVPGFVETPWQKEKPEQIKQNIYKKTAIHRFASVDEVVDAYRFCIDNPFVNGSLIEVNGGYSYK